MKIVRTASPFAKSVCKCEFCSSMHLAQQEWDTFVPETTLQKNMIQVVAKIEESDVRDTEEKKRSRTRLRATRLRARKTLKKRE